jgi:hypothetical protein
MKKVYLIHGWGGSSEGGWFDWLKTELPKKGYEVIAFDMPDTENPRIETWVKYLEQNIKNVDEETYFMGHSVGCQTIMRYLEKLPKHLEIGGGVFVAGWFNLKGLGKEEMEIAHPWINSKIDYERIHRHTEKFLAIFSDDDHFVPLTESKLFKEKLGAKIIVKKKQGHFEGVDEIPEILKFLK